MKCLEEFSEIFGHASKSGSETTLKYVEDFFSLVFTNNWAENCLKFVVDLNSKFMTARWDLLGLVVARVGEKVCGVCVILCPATLTENKFIVVRYETATALKVCKEFVYIAALIRATNCC